MQEKGVARLLFQISAKTNFQERSRLSTRNRLRMARLRRTTVQIEPNLADLICGVSVADDPYIDKDYVGLVNRLRSDLSELHPYIQASVEANSLIPASAVFPFLARKFLELSLTALLTRIDPLRVIAARKNQLDASFEPGRQNASSLAWSGDLLPAEKTPKDIWDSSNLKKGVERSFLGWHISAVAIADGLRWLSDEVHVQSTWLRQLSAQDHPLDWIRGRLVMLYSVLSKGVHAEYLLDDSTAFDQSSIQQHMQDCYMLVLLLAAASHRSPLFLRSIPPKMALDSLQKFEHQIISKCTQ